MKKNFFVISCLIALFLLMGRVYAEGNWQSHPVTGCKVWTFNPLTDTTFSWTGNCKDGYIDGTGTLQWFEAGVPGDNYIGQYLRGKAHGKGILTWASPSARYEGNFLNGQRSGKGIQKFANGDQYEGDWNNDQPNGKGVYIWINDDRYQGEFIEGKAHGKGVKIWADGTRYEGDFFNGQMHGYGTITLRNGRIFQGRWENNNYLGP